MGKLDDVAIMKVLAAGKNPAEQDGCINRRDFRVPYSFARIDIGKVKKESAMRRQLLPKKIERRNHAQACVTMGDEAAVFCNADCRQPKASGGNACHDAIVPRNDIAAIFNQSGLRIGLLPEEEESFAFKFVQKLIILGRKSCLYGGRRWVPFVSRRLCQHWKRTPLSDRQTQGDAGHLAQQLAPASAICVRVGYLTDSRFVDAVDFIFPFIYAHSGSSVCVQATDSR